MFFPNLKLKSTFFEKLPIFYQNILTFWFEFSRGIPLTASSILSESLWNNNIIQIHNDVINPSFLNCKKRLFVADLFNLDGKIKKWIDFRKEHNFSEKLYFKWVQIVDALPSHWNKILKEDDGKSRVFCEFIPHIITNAKLYPLSKLTSQETLPWKKYLLARSIYYRFVQ